MEKSIKAPGLLTDDKAREMDSSDKISSSLDNNTHENFKAMTSTL